jgi:hypothetical protein
MFITAQKLQIYLGVPIRHFTTDPSVEMERQSESPMGSGRLAFKGTPAKIETAREYVNLT